MIIALSLLTVFMITLGLWWNAMAATSVPFTPADNCTASEAVTVLAVQSDPSAYNGRMFCLEGYYVVGWETQALFPGLRSAGKLELERAPHEEGLGIWTSLPKLSPIRLRCIRVTNLQRCFGKIRVYGRFEYERTKEYGNDGQYTGQFIRVAR